MRFDAHAENGGDNAHYWPDPGDTPGYVPYLSFGDGGIDNAEDQDMIIHEYGHAIHDALMTGEGFGGEESRITEGSADYLAVSFRRTRSLFQQNKVFPWDGNGETWNGRTLSATHIYPNQWTGTHDPAGVLWASTMMDLESRSDVGVGRDVTTTLLLTSFSFVTPSSIVPDHVQAIFRSDRDIPAYNGFHLKSLGRVFYDRGFFNAGPGTPPIHPSNLVSGNITANTTWSGIKWVNGFTYIKSGVTVTVPDNAYLFIDNNQKIIVESGGSLVIQSGARIICYTNAELVVNSGGNMTVNGGGMLQFGSGSKITSNGTFTADSNDPNKRITFIGATATPGSWTGITINSGSSSNVSTMRRCDVKYATTGITINYTGNTNNVTIDKCRISNNSLSGVTVNGNAYSGATVHPVISNSQINSNGSYGIYLYNYAKPLITTNRVESNYPSGIYGTSSASATVEYNYVKGTAYGSGYGISFEYSSHAQVHRNTITQNTAGSGGVFAGSSSNLVAYGSGTNKGRNKITANSGDGIYALSSTPIFGNDVTGQWGNNQIQDNTGYQAKQSSGNQLKAEQCYWAGQQTDISGNVDNVPYLSAVPDPVGWGYSDAYDPSLLIRQNHDFALFDTLLAARRSSSTLSQNGTVANGFDPATWSVNFAATMATGLEKGDWVGAAEVITELWRELQDGHVPIVDYTLLADYADANVVESSVRKYLALTLVEKSLAKKEISTALADLAKFQKNNSAQAAELLANTGIIQLFRQNDLMAAQNVLTQLQTMAQTGDAGAVVQVNLFEKIIQDYQHRNASAANVSRPVVEPAQPSIFPATQNSMQNYPNPFNPTTSIRFYLPENQNVRLMIYDLNGKLVRVLVDGELNAGEQTISWDGRNQNGQTVASGVYFYELVVGNKVERKKMMLVR